MYYFPPRDDIWSVMRSLLGDFVGPFILVCGSDASFFLAFRALSHAQAACTKEKARERALKRAL